MYTLERKAMKASVLDLRRKMSAVLKAIDQNESVTLTYHGKDKAILIPSKGKKTASPQHHPSFGMWKDRSDLADVPAKVRALRKGRGNAL
jgi:antitoxin (DNA-binding transcriptional repressor) of toxin-antitoxin stability system